MSVTPPCHADVYGNSILEAIEGLEKEYANLQPEIMTAQDARALLSA